MLEWPWSFLVGYGWNSFDSSGIWKAAHNEYVDRLYELGVFGLSLYIWLLYQITTRARRRLATADPELRRILIGYVFSISTVVVSIFFAALPGPWTIFWVITGLVMGLQATPVPDSKDIDHRNGAPGE
jgi:O-antigen ligase